MKRSVLTRVLFTLYLIVAWNRVDGFVDLDTEKKPSSKGHVESRKDNSGNHPIAMVVGMPKAGTTSFRDYFACGNMKAAHWTCPDGSGTKPTPRCAACMRNNMEQNQDPFLGCGTNIEVYAQMDDPNEDPTLCYFPQIEMLDYIHEWYPNITLILNQRSTMNWLASLKHWHHMNERIKACNITGLPSGVGNDAELIAWYRQHEYDILAFVEKYPSHKLIQVHIDDADAGAIMEAAFGITHECYGHSNAKGHHGDAVDAKLVREHMEHTNNLQPTPLDLDSHHPRKSKP